MSLDPAETTSCRCGAMHKDGDAGRFGSSLGDEAIEIYRPGPMSFLDRYSDEVSG